MKDIDSKLNVSVIWRRAHGWKPRNRSAPNVDHKEIADVWPIYLNSHSTNVSSPWEIRRNWSTCSLVQCGNVRWVWASNCFTFLLNSGRWLCNQQDVTTQCKNILLLRKETVTSKSKFKIKRYVAFFLLKHCIRHFLYHETSCVHFKFNIFEIEKYTLLYTRRKIILISLFNAIF